jgi:arginine-tRNA-protein transferase
LPDQLWSLEYDYVADASPQEYLGRMIDGWRHFGSMLFRPACQNCNACRPLRVCVERFRPNRSQKRNRQANEGTIELRIGRPAVTRSKLALYDRYHAYQTQAKGWPEHPAKDAASYATSFVHNPFAVEEWNYYLAGKLVGVGYVDALAPVPAVARQTPGTNGRIPLLLSETGEPLSGGLSAIYFYYEPRERQRGLGVWNILTLIEETRRRNLPYLYLGYYVEGCPSMSYKPLFTPNQVREEGKWRPFRE